MTTFPTIEQVTHALRSVQRSLDVRDFPTEDDFCDIRLQVYEDGDWAIRSGDPSYDLDHRGFWGASSISPSDTAESLKETAENLLEQAQDQAAMNEDN